ncbi:hypothetical protein JXA47_11030 [Candidatus Sumerlaeota bacterium]|nr:hypothetical protein [Candidatus Sumerlaeota bacterium]
MRPTVLISLAACALVLSAALGCGGELPEAVRQPLLVVPAGARAVVLADIASSRQMDTFINIEHFLQDQDTDREYRGMLPFDYQEFVDHWRLDPLRDVDQVVLALYDDGWLVAMVGKFDSDHMIGVLREEGELAELSVRPGTEERESYPMAEVEARGQGLFAAVVNPLMRYLGEAGSALRVLSGSPQADRRTLIAWPSENIMVVSDNRSRMGYTLDLWENVPGESLLDEPGFGDLYESRPHSAPVWVGFPRTFGFTAPLSTLQIELDIRDFFTPKLILGYETQENAETSMSGVERAVRTAGDWLATFPELVRDPFARDDPLINWVSRWELADIFARVGPLLSAVLIKEAQVIEIEMPLEIDEFKRIFAALAQEVVR